MYYTANSAVSWHWAKEKTLKSTSSRQDLTTQQRFNTIFKDDESIILRGISILSATRVRNTLILFSAVTVWDVIHGSFDDVSETVWP
jgi:hypothetical protein